MQANQSNPKPEGAAQPHRHIPILDRLITLGADFAEELHAQAMANKTAKPDHKSAATLKNLAAAFDSIARCIRRSVLLVQKLEAPPRAAKAPPRNPPPDRIAVRKQVIRGVEDVIQGHAKDTEQAQALHAEFLDRLDAPDLEDDIITRPVADIVAEIRHDLGLPHMNLRRPFLRRTPEDLETLQSRAATPPGAPAPRAPFHPSPPIPPPPQTFGPAEEIPDGEDPPEESAEAPLENQISLVYKLLRG